MIRLQEPGRNGSDAAPRAATNAQMLSSGPINALGRWCWGPYSGFFTPTEAVGGAFGAFVIAIRGAARGGKLAVLTEPERCRSVSLLARGAGFTAAVSVGGVPGGHQRRRQTRNGPTASWRFKW